MATLTIRNVDDKVVATLKARAKAQGRSLEAELRKLLSDTAKTADRRKRLIAEVKRIAAMTRDVPQTDSVELLREDRDR